MKHWVGWYPWEPSGEAKLMKYIMGGGPTTPPPLPYYNHDVVRHLFWVKNPNLHSNRVVSKPSFGFRKST